MGQAQVPQLHIQPDLPKDSPFYGTPFSPSIFSAEDSQWELLQAYCVENNIPQTSLNRIFLRLLSSVQAPLRGFRVHLPDLKQLFVHESHVLRDLVDLLAPYVFQKSVPGVPELVAAHSVAEIAFTRFVICAHSFCRQPMSDIIFDFLAACRSNPELNMNAFVYGFNLLQLLLLLTLGDVPERPYGVVHLLKQYCFADEEDKITIRSVIQLGVKYPLMFYPLRILCYKRLRRMCGFSECAISETQLEFSADCSLFERLESTEDAREETAVVLISDAVHQRAVEGRTNSRPERFVLHIERHKRVAVIDDKVWQQVKEVFGYRSARALLIESRLPLAPGTKLPFDMDEGDVLAGAASAVRLKDPKLERDFEYCVGSGRRAWVDAVRDREDGKVLRETTHKSGPNYFIES